VCGGLFDARSRQATHNEMGPWFIRQVSRPFQPGCSYQTLVKLIDRGVVDKHTLLRGPTTRQFWTIAKRVPGVAHVLGFCHACGAAVDPDDHGCQQCGAPFGACLDRDSLGLPEIRPLPDEPAQTSNGSTERTAVPSSGNGPPASPRLEAPPPANAGISSFATDEELLQAQPTEDALDDPDAPAVDSALANLPANVNDPAATDEHDVFISPAMRSMQRRLAHQQRTIHRLIVLIILVALAGVITILLVLAGARYDAASDERLAPPSTDYPSPPAAQSPSEGIRDPDEAAELDTELPDAGLDESSPIRDPEIPSSYPST
jgi:hypothetical protein